VNIYMKATNPEDIEFTVSITMSMKQWRDLQAQLPSKWPSIDLYNAIQHIINQAKRSYIPKETPHETND
jgi:hypothetical protein